MNKNRKILIFIMVIAIVVGLKVLEQVDRRSALSTTLIWARLSDYPKCAKHIQVTTKGNSFTRGFIVEFTCSTEEIKKWIDQTPSLVDAEIIENQNSTRCKIKPGGGAVSAELGVNWRTNKVRIITSWS